MAPAKRQRFKEEYSIQFTDVATSLPGRTSFTTCGYDINLTYMGRGAIKQHVQKLKHFRNGGKDMASMLELFLFCYLNGLHYFSAQNWPI